MKDDKSFKLISIFDITSKKIPYEMASNSYLDIIKSPIFWRQHIEFIVYILLSTFIAASLFNLTLPAGSINSPLMFLYTLGIHFLGFCVIYKSLNILVETYQEQALANHIIDKGSDILRKAKGKVKDKSPPSLEALESWLPFDVKNRVLAKIFEDAHREAQDFIYSSPTVILQPHQQYFRNQLGSLASIQTIALRLGILGTFIGLILAIITIGNSSFTDMYNDAGKPDINEILKSFQKRQASFNLTSKDLFHALYIAFGTSIAGLEVSIIINIILPYVRKKQENLLHRLDEATHVICSLMRNSLNESTLLSSFAQMRQSMISLERRMHSEFEGMSDIQKELTNEITEQIQVTQTGLTALRSAKEEWVKFADSMAKRHDKILTEMAEQSGYAHVEFGDFLSRLNTTQQQFLEQAKQSLDLLSVGKLGKSIDESIRQSGIKISDNIGENIRDTSSQLRIYTESLKTMTESSNKLSNSIDSFVNVVQKLSKLDSQFKSLELQNRTLENTLKDLTNRIPSPYTYYLAVVFIFYLIYLNWP